MIKEITEIMNTPVQSGTRKEGKVIWIDTIDMMTDDKQARNMADMETNSQYGQMPEEKPGMVANVNQEGRATWKYMYEYTTGGPG